MPDSFASLAARIEAALPRPALEYEVDDAVQGKVHYTVTRELQRTKHVKDARAALAEMKERAAKLEAALRAIAADDLLVTANEAAFSVHAYRRCKEQAQAALSSPETE